MWFISTKVEMSLCRHELPVLAVVIVVVVVDLVIGISDLQFYKIILDYRSVKYKHGEYFQHVAIKCQNCTNR